MEIIGVIIIGLLVGLFLIVYIPVVLILFGMMLVVMVFVLIISQIAGLPVTVTQNGKVIGHIIKFKYVEKL